VITMNGKPASINTRLEPNSEIEICPSTVGADAMITIEQLEEYHTSTITFIVNGKKIVCPRFVEVNGKLEPASYVIKEGDEIDVKLMDIDPKTGKFKLSRKVLLPKPEKK
jgi:uncharacterized protein YlzI (FlbEa/FlbD family)